MLTLTRITILVSPNMEEVAKEFRRKDRLITWLFVGVVVLVLVAMAQQFRYINIEEERNLLLIDRKAATIDLNYEKKKVRNLEEFLEAVLNQPTPKTYNNESRYHGL